MPQEHELLQAGVPDGRLQQWAKEAGFGCLPWLLFGGHAKWPGWVGGFPLKTPPPPEGGKDTLTAKKKKHQKGFSMEPMQERFLEVRTNPCPRLWKKAWATLMALCSIKEPAVNWSTVSVAQSPLCSRGM